MQNISQVKFVKSERRRFEELFKLQVNIFTEEANLWFAEEVSLLQLVHVLFPGAKDDTFRHQEWSQDLPPLVSDKDKGAKWIYMQLAGE